MELRNIGPNQSEVKIGNKTVLFSHSIPVAANVGGKYYRTQNFYSRTINSHINKWIKGCAEQKPQLWFHQLVK
jgi:hypothetical protein